MTPTGTSDKPFPFVSPATVPDESSVLRVWIVFGLLQYFPLPFYYEFRVCVEVVFHNNVPSRHKEVLSSTILVIISSNMSKLVP